MFFWLFVRSINAQEFGYTTFNTTDGLAQNQVHTFCKDGNGYLWIGTYGGVSRFDGKNFKNYTKVNGLSGNLIYNIENTGSSVFINTGLSIDEIREDTVINIFNSNERIIALIEYGGKVFAQISGSLYLIGNDSLRKVFSGLLGNSNKGYWVVNNKLLTIGDGFHSFFEIDTSSWEANLWYSNDEYFMNDISWHHNHYFIRANTEYSRLGTDILIMDSSRGQCEIQKFEDSFHESEEIESYFPHNRNEIVIGSSNGNLYWFKNGKMKKINDHFYSINEFLGDKENYLWMASEKGLVKIKLDGFYNYHTGDKIPGNVWSIFSENDSVVWFATYNNGIHKYVNGNILESVYNYKNKRKIYFYFSSSRGFNNDFLIPVNNGVFKYDLKRMDYEILNQNVSGSCLTIFKDTLNNAIITSNYYRLIKIDKHYNMTELFDVSDLGPEYGIISITYGHGKYYLGLSNNMVTYDPVKKKGELLGYNDYRFNSITSDHKGNVWCATDRGLLHFQGHTSYKVILPQPEAFNNIAFSKTNELILQGTRFVHFIDLDHFYSKNEISISTFDESDCYYGEGTQGNSIIDKRGNIWLPGNETCVMIDPSEIRKSHHNHKVYFEKISCSQNNVDFAGVSDIRNHLVLKHQSNNIIFEFNTVELIHPERIRYIFRLNGFHDKWSVPSKERQIHFTSLRPGTYFFEVKASSGTNFSDAPVSSFSFQILPPFWKTWWFILCIVIIVAGSIYLYYRRRIDSIRKKNLAEQKLARLEMDFLKMQIRPHFIFNCLEIIKSFISSGNEEKAVETTNNFGKLLRYVVQSTEFEEVSLQEDLNILKIYVDLQKLRMGQNLTFNVSVNKEISLNETMIPPMVVQPFIENAIKHGIGPRGKGTISVNIDFHKTMKGFLEIIVRDDGIGRNPKAIQAQRNIGYKPVGIKNSEERMKIFNKLAVGNIEVHDLKQGTEVVLLLKLFK